MLTTNYKQLAAKFALCFMLISLNWGTSNAQNQNDQDLYYWSDLGKTNLILDNESYILLAKDKTTIESKLSANVDNENIKKASKTGFLIYKNKKNKVSENDIFEELSLNKENWEIHPGLKTSAGSTPFHPTKKVLFKMKNGEPVSTINDILDNYSVVSLYEVRSDVYTIEVASAVQAIALANAIYESGHAKFSQPNFTVSLTFNNDPLFDQQFQMHNTGQTVNGTTSTADIDADALEAWDITTGSSSVRVAVFDRGLEAHPDLTDANGNSTIIGGFSPDLPGGNGTPNADPGFHGMACAGIINAQHNDIGVRGIAPGVRLLGVNIFTAQTTESLASAFTWAKDNGADVISNSWSFTDSDCSTDNPALNDAIEDAFLNGRNGKGCLIVFSSGNQGENGCVAYPARLNTVTAVGAITSKGDVPNYGQTGPNLDLVAPTSDVVSANANVHTIDREGNFGLVGGDYLTFFGGTSAAAPLVAGTAALVYSVNPDLTVAQMRNILYTSADDMGPSGRDNNFGHGRVNAHQAVLAANNSGNPNTNNIALNKPTTQSSTAFNGVASRAVDGNTNGNSFTHTENEQGWWRVDLQDEYDISTINVFNRTNCCSDRLVGASVYVGNIGSSNPNDYTLVGALNDSGEINFTNLNVSGRYVLIDRNNTNFLSLAEVQVFGTLAPVGGGNNSYSIDFNGSSNNTRPGWSGFNGTSGSINVSGVNFELFSVPNGNGRDRGTGGDVNRDFVFEDGPSAGIGIRINGLPSGTYNVESWHNDTSPNISGAVNIDIARSGSARQIVVNNHTFKGEPATYQLVSDGSSQYIISIVENGSENRSRLNGLRLVRTSSEGSTPEQNVALNKPTTQSSTSFNGVSSRAVDGNTNGSLTSHTENEQGWWRVDLQDEYDISTINVFNRTNCCSDRLVGASIYVGNIGSSNPNDYTLVGALNGSEQINFTNLNVSGRYVLIDRNNTNFLSLSEVQVFGTLVSGPTTNFDFFSNEEITIFPNPAQEFLKINLSSVQQVRTAYIISDINGRLMMEGQFDTNHLDQEYIELNNLSDGNYFLRISPEGEKPIVYKFIVKNR